MEPLVSILIPAYNASAHLAASIESALAQSWPKKEIIVIDDGSKDDTLAIARQFTQRGVIVETQPNQGAASTRNNLFNRSKGDYLQWLDADDLLSANKISSQLAALEPGKANDRILLSSGWGYFHFRPEKAAFRATALWADLSPTEWMLRKIEQNLHMQTATWLVSRKLSLAAGPWNTKLLGDDDGEYFARVMMACESIRFVSDARVYYRRPGQTSLSHIGRSNKKLEAQFASMLLNIDYVRRMDDGPRGRRACVTYLQNWLTCFYPDRPDIVQRAQDLARELGGQLATPSLSWKYAWIQKIAGWDNAKKAQGLWAKVKSSLIRNWDFFLFSLQGKGKSRETAL